MTINGPPPAYYFEDRTGLATGSDFDEAYDRAFLRVSATPQRTQNAGLMVYTMGQRSTSHGERDRRHYYREPAVTLDFGPKGALGMVHFAKGAQPMPMHNYLRRVSLFGGCVSTCVLLRAVDAHRKPRPMQVFEPQIPSTRRPRVSMVPPHGGGAGVDSTLRVFANEYPSNFIVKVRERARLPCGALCPQAARPCSIRDLG
jgi:hypothetical protein